MLVNTNNIPFTQTNGKLFDDHGVNVRIARLDLLDPIVSGNKIFKLNYFLDEALLSGYKRILTFGGAYSNHLVATAYACLQLGFESIGIVRGEEPKELSHTLRQCLQYKMHLHFIPRDAYKNTHEQRYVEKLQQQFGNFIFVPEGGYHPLGADGAALIMDKIKDALSTHICTAVGTATTLAGLLKGSGTDQEIIAIPVLKGMHDIGERIAYLTGKPVPSQLKIWDQYHFGGYAKRTTELISFMNELYREQQLPTDFVYTAKMMYGVFDQISKGHFPKGSRILCLHTGGLQGNKSLPKGSLEF